ncbi:sensor histidine kinase [Planctobacterium marinum]|uniref:Histidine kinase n=1 Tax=Planctobacterium marinum TaxID=1631968 RepID=A0AA48HTQ1_9ALTE|nr:histidine kinase [Planctobacterium marinum]
MPLFIQRIHQRLLPSDSDTGYLPYFWLVYLIMFILPLSFGDRPLWHYAASMVVVPVFLALYFYTFWQTGARALVCILAILGLGMATAWFNPGASVFFVYAAAFCVQLKQPRKALIMVFSIAAVAALYSFLMQLPGFFYLPAIVISILIGCVNIYEGELRQKNQLLKVSQDELAKMAATAERERIARDLHDLIGHTFSLITVKAQLAHKLADIDIDKSKQELKDLEHLSRTAMAEIRETVHNYQQKDMTSEIAKAKALAKSADIEFHSEIEAIPQKESTNSALAWVIRESFTNMVKHSEATSCQLSCKTVADQYRLTISDNGQPQTEITAGDGLTGIKERVTALGGKLTVATNGGFSIQVEVPFA